MNYRAQGERLDRDIRSLIQNKMSKDEFLKIWEQPMYVIVIQLFWDRAYEILRMHDKLDQKEEAKSEMKVLSNKISMFCVAFV